MGCHTSHINQVLPDTLVNTNLGLPIYPSDIQETVEFLYNAIESRNEEEVLHLIFKYTHSECISQLKEEFFLRYSIDITTFSFQNLSANASEFLRLRIETLNKNVCHFINFHLREKPPNYENHIFSILLGFEELPILDLSNSYRTIYGSKLIEKLSNLFEDWPVVYQVLSMLQKEIWSNDTRIENCEANDENLKSKAGELKLAADNGYLGDTQRGLLTVIQKHTRQEMRNIFTQYAHDYQRDLIADIQKTDLEEKSKMFLINAVVILRNSSVHFAKLINEFLKLSEDDSLKYFYLQFYILTRSEDALKDIKKSYRFYFFESLQEDIKSLIQDPFVKIGLIKALSKVSSV